MLRASSLQRHQDQAHNLKTTTNLAGWQPLGAPRGGVLAVLREGGEGLEGLRGGELCSSQGPSQQALVVGMY